ncbi:hypothetical protein SUBVAR_05955 [Subdoligranulum variabile DSM 15176]|uniref:Uncharacterized protein n=1 Tax=Subdoligranulum variabile DSM 15176 TaxID=411471 RepID=D1PNN4_9FIRM|nr:hypothetical protein SUBVAR_05955 [Subdoligranulum variabile DSM 15176]
MSKPFRRPAFVLASIRKGGNLSWNVVRCTNSPVYECDGRLRDLPVRKNTTNQTQKRRT